MNAVEQARGLEFATKIAAIVNLFKSVFPDARADLKPWANDPDTQELVDRTLEGGSKYRIEDKDLDIYRKPFLKSSDVGRSLVAIVRNLQMKQSMAEIESGFRDWEKPTFILWGMKDPWLPFEQAQQFANTLKNAEVVQIQEGGHYPQEHWSGKVSESLLPFLRRQAL